MPFRKFVLVMMCAALACGAAVVLPVVSVSAQQNAGGGAQNEATPIQRLEVMRSRLETMRRTLNSAVAGINAKDKGTKDAPADDPRARLRGLEKEVGSVMSEVSDLRAKQERADRYDVSLLDKLETSITDLNERVEAGLRATAGERRVGDAAAATTGGEKKKKPGFFGRILGRGGDDKYEEL
ncbi:MAG TPA: hypothetical protein VM866_05660, partial [Pyrinomonadaceae bacterium]|nr:hypothetical protein [Pyrinomonadaceae bacterium]